jgi:hypothetical protein
MSEFKFVCPACGQHMQCERAYVGHKTNCPGCNAEVRVPFSNSPGGAPGALPRAELVLDAAADPSKDPGQPSLPATAPLTERERQIAAAREGHQVSLYPPLKPRRAFILSEKSPSKESQPLSRKPGAGDDVQSFPE